MPVRHVAKLTVGAQECREQYLKLTTNEITFKEIPEALTVNITESARFTLLCMMQATSPVDCNVTLIAT